MNPQSLPNRLAGMATVLAALAATAGLAVSGLYRDAPNWAQQARGTDLATLLLAVPILTIGLWTARRGSAAGRLAIIAGLLYLAYDYAIFSFSVAMNPLTALHITIFGLAVWGVMLSGRVPAIAAAGLGIAQTLSRRLAASLLVGFAGLFGLLWLSQIAAAAMTGVLPPDVERAGIATNPVYALDLALFLPLCAVAGIGLLRRSRAGALAFPMLIWVALTSASIIGGFVLAAFAGEEVPIVVIALVTGPGLASAILAAAPLLRRPAGADDAISVTTLGEIAPVVREG